MVAVGEAVLLSLDTTIPVVVVINLAVIVVVGAVVVGTVVAFIWSMIARSDDTLRVDGREGADDNCWISASRAASSSTTDEARVRVLDTTEGDISRDFPGAFTPSSPSTSPSLGPEEQIAGQRWAAARMAGLFGTASMGKEGKPNPSPGKPQAHPGPARPALMGRRYASCTSDERKYSTADIAGSAAAEDT